MPTIDQFLRTVDQKNRSNTAKIDQLQARIQAMQQRIATLTSERNEARASAAIAHDAIRRLSSIVASDQTFTRLSKNLRGAIASCLESADPEAYQTVAEEMDVMYCALETISRQINGEGQTIAMNTLERLNQ